MTNKRSNRLLAVGSCLALCFGAWLPALGQDQPCDNQRLESATLQFERGLFDRVFEVLDPCVPDGFVNRDHRVVAYRLMALSHIALDSYTEAEMWVGQILKTQSEYRASEETDPPAFVDMVHDLRPRWYTWLWSGNEWYKWTGRVALAGVAVSLPFLLRKNREPDLPLPPDLPER